MEYRRLGRSGLKVSKLALGTMNFGGPTGKEAAVRMVHTAIDAGINLLDCAGTYSGGESERILGEALAGAGKRKNVFLTSKVFMLKGLPKKESKRPGNWPKEQHRKAAACRSWRLPGSFTSRASPHRLSDPGPRRTWKSCFLQPG